MFVYLLAFLFISTLGINADATECENTTDDNIIDGMVQVTPEYVQNLIDAFQYRTYEIATTSLSPGTYTLYTTNNTPVEAIVYEPMSSYEVAAYLDLYFEYSQYLTFYVENDGDALITNAYNCHYYAWCSDWCENQYWISYADPFIADPHTYMLQDSDTLQIGDIVTYWAGDECKHSAVVYSFANGTVYLKSKWGPLGLYVHEMSEVPDEYKDNGEINIKTYRAIESGVRGGRIDTLCTLAEYHNVTLDYLIFGKNTITEVIED